MVQERTHTRFSPSRSEQFFYCHGCVNLLARVPVLPEDPHAAEGQRAHNVLEAGLNGGAANATAAIEMSIHCVEDFTIDFKAAINTALDYISLLCDSLHVSYGENSYKMFVETRVNPPVHNAPGEAAGYCDVAIVCPAARRLWVIDYKHGVGVSKAVEGNTQVRQYAAGFLYDEESPIKDMVDQIDEVTLVIIQPRSFHKDGEIREATVKATELVDYLMELDAHIEACLQPDAPLVVDVEKQCRFCEGRDVCPALEQAAAKALVPMANSMREVTAKGMTQVELMSVERLAYIKSMRPTIDAMLNAVDKRIAQLLKDNVRVPGFKQVQADAKREWHENEHERAHKLAALIGCEPTDLYRISFITITDAEQMMVDAFKKRVNKKKRNQAAAEARQQFAYFTTKKSSGNLTVVSDDDPRPAVDRVAQNFAGVNVLPPPTQET